MQVWGKILGAFFGFLLGGPFGLLLGLFLGHKFDKARSNIYYTGFSGSRSNAAEQQSAFFNACFSVMGHVAKAKGRVTKDEIRVASTIMDRMGLQGEARRQAQNAFRDGKSEDFPLEETLMQIRRGSGGRADLLQFFLELQIQAAFADGSLHPSERQLLHVIARILGFSPQQLEQRLNMQEAAFRFQQGGFHQQYQQQGQFQQAPTRDQLADAYEVLGIKEGASAQELKRAYRKQMNEHHPDKLAAKGLPPEMMELAKQKTQQLQAAYDLIRKTNGFK
ncbi:molecular chaperone DnaJ [Photobacterium aquae]|uniref:Co-chaperone protein DjlA n=1 Tax=Photobacterium aquae TaxID=1195763 RepID=A0A0J1GRR7_9GAMM|nr:co-chaperone DjlA [Photobacterium aquae]KLV02435.1 molecular chaperone DnaJ [Photobacterium aquae]